MKLCFSLGGRVYCITIPVLMWPWPWPPNGNGDPWKHIGDWLGGDPSPQPWQVNLPIVATVAVLAQHAHGDLRGHLQRAVETEMAAIKAQLPEGASLQFAERAR